MWRPHRTWTDEQLERVIGDLLRIGVILAATLVLLGGALYLVHYGASVPHYRVFRGEPGDLREVQGIVTEAFSLHSRGIIQLGLLLLIATPLARVVFSVIAFALERDAVYVRVTLMVLAALLFSLLGGHL